MKLSRPLFFRFISYLVLISYFRAALYPVYAYDMPQLEAVFLKHKPLYGIKITSEEAPSSEALPASLSPTQKINITLKTRSTPQEKPLKHSFTWQPGMTGFQNTYLAKNNGKVCALWLSWNIENTHNIKVSDKGDVQLEKLCPSTDASLSLKLHTSGTITTLNVLSHYLNLSGQKIFFQENTGVTTDFLVLSQGNVHCKGHIKVTKAASLPMSFFQTAGTGKAVIPFLFKVPQTLVNQGYMEFQHLLGSEKIETLENFGTLKFKPDTATDERFRLKGFEADKENKVTLRVGKLRNHQTLDSIESLEIQAVELDNNGGKIHTPAKLTASVDILKNDQGTLTGAQGTKVTVKTETFTNPQGFIGAGGETHLHFENSPKDQSLGTLEGESVFLTDSTAQGRASFKEGRIKSRDYVWLTGHELLLPGVELETPTLHLSLYDFLINSQKMPQYTTVFREPHENLRLTHPYLTRGELKICEPGLHTKEQALQKMKKRFGEGYKERPEATHKLEILADVRTDEGLSIFAPQASFRYGDNEAEAMPEMLLEKTFLQAYVSAFDFEKGVAGINNLTVHAPLGIHLGRLVRDPNADIFATFGPHKQHNYSHNLDGDIVEESFEYLGKKIRGVYDGRFLLTFPKVISNQTSLNVKEGTEFQGALIHHGYLETYDFIFNSLDESSTCEAGNINIRNNFTQIGLGSLTLKRVIGKFNYTYHTYGGWRIPHPGCIAQFSCSDPASLNVYGQLIQKGETGIVNEASNLYVYQPCQNARISSHDFIAYIFQREYSKDEQNELSLNNMIGYWSRNYHHLCLGALPYQGLNSFTSGDSQRYFLLFLVCTNNFDGAQKVFAPSTSSPTALVTSSAVTKMGGNLTTPLLLIKVGEKGITLGTANPYYVEPKDPLCDLVSKGFSVHNTYVTPSIRKLIDTQIDTYYFFTLRERFFFNESSAQAFYRDVHDHLMVLDPKVGFKPYRAEKVIFSLSPKMLLDSVRDQCQKTLNRGYFFDQHSIDYDTLKELHRHASDYLVENKLVGESLEKALFDPAAKNNIPLPTKPLIFYEVVMNEEKLEQLMPKLYIPHAMIKEAWGERGSKFLTKMTLTISEGMNIGTLLCHLREKFDMPPQLLEGLEKAVGKALPNPSPMPLLKGGAAASKPLETSPPNAQAFRVTTRPLPQPPQNLTQGDNKNLTPNPTQRSNISLNLSRESLPHRRALLNLKGPAVTEYSIDGKPFKLQNVCGLNNWCFFNALGLKAEEEKTKLIRRQNDPLVRKMVANDILIVVKELALSNTQESRLFHLQCPELAKALDYPSYKEKVKALNLREQKKNDALQQGLDIPQLSPELTPAAIKADREKIDDDLHQKALTPQSFKAFIEYLIDGKRMMNMQVDAENNGLANHTTIDAIAYINKIGLRIYKPDNRTQLLSPPAHEYIPLEAREVAYLYHEGIHFQALLSSENQAPGSFKNSLVSQERATGLASQNKGKMASPAATPTQVSFPKTTGNVTYHGTHETDTFINIVHGDVLIQGEVRAKRALVASLFGNIGVESLVQRLSGINGGFQDVVAQQARLTILEEQLILLAGGNIAFLGAETSSVEETYIQALGNVFSLPVELVARSIQEIHGKRKHTVIETTRVHNQRSTHQSDKKVQIVSGNQTILGASRFKTPTLDIHSEEGIKALEIQDVVMQHFTSTQKKRGMLGSRTKKSQGGYCHKTSLDLEILAQTVNLTTKNNNITLISPTIKPLTDQGMPETTLEALNGTVEILLGRESLESYYQSSYKNLAWQRMYSESQRHLTYKEPQILGKLTMKSKEILVELVAGHVVPEFVKQLEEDNSLNLIVNYLHEKHECESKKIGGPSAALTALVAVAIAALTAGTGAGALLAAGLQLGSGAAAVGACGAAISSLGTQLAVGLLNNKGDVGRALGTLTDKKFVKSFAISVASAGATGHLCDKFNIKTPNAATLKGADLSTKFATHFKYNLVRAAVDTGVKTTFEGGKVHKTLENNLKNAVISSVSATVANQIGDWYGKGNIDPLTHKALHGALGAGLGALRGDPVAGALASVVAETIAELSAGDMQKLHERVQEKAAQQGIAPGSEKYQELVQTELAPTLNWSKFGASVATFLAGRDVNVGAEAAANALDNNFANSFTLEALNQEDDWQANLWQQNQEEERGRTLEKTKPSSRDHSREGGKLEKAARHVEADQAIRQEVHQAARDPNLPLWERIFLHLGAMSLEQGGVHMDMAYQTMRMGCYTKDAVTDVIERKPVHEVTKEKVKDAGLWTAALISQVGGKGLGKKPAGPGGKSVNAGRVPTSSSTLGALDLSKAPTRKPMSGNIAGPLNVTRETARKVEALYHSTDQASVAPKLTKDNSSSKPLNNLGRGEKEKTLGASSNGSTSFLSQGTRPLAGSTVANLRKGFEKPDISAANLIGAGQSQQACQMVFTSNQDRNRVVANANANPTATLMKKTGTNDGAGYITTTLSSQEKTWTLYNQAAGGSGRTTTTTTRPLPPKPETTGTNNRPNLSQGSKDGNNGDKKRLEAKGNSSAPPITKAHDRVAHDSYYGRKVNRAEIFERQQRIAIAKPANYDKHTRAKTEEQAKIMSNTGKRNAQYLPNVNRNSLELEALKKGIFVPQEKGADYFIYQFDRPIGYNEGKKTSWVRVELHKNSQPEYHGHPISEDKAKGYLNQ